MVLAELAHPLSLSSFLYPSCHRLPRIIFPIFVRHIMCKREWWVDTGHGDSSNLILFSLSVGDYYRPCNVSKLLEYKPSQSQLKYLHL